MAKLMMTLSLLVTILFSPLLMVGASLPATNSDYVPFDNFISAQMNKHGLSGVSLAIVKNGELAYMKGYGNSGSNPVTPETQMFIGSLSKSFTGLAIAQLVEQGKIDLQAPIQTYIPWFTISNTDEAAKIKIHHLLHHTSGLSESGFSVVLPANASMEEMARSLRLARLTAPVGTKFQYFNYGYDLLAYIVEIVSGEKYADYLKAHIFDPLGMSSSTADPSAAVEISPGTTRIFGFSIPMRQKVRVHDIGSGFIVSTAEDLSRYMIAMINLANHKENGVLNPESATWFFQPDIASYGMGWFIDEGNNLIYHGGAIDNFHTEQFFYPATGSGFILLVNQGHYLDHLMSCSQLTDGVKALLEGRNPPLVSTGISTRWIGWGIGAFVLFLLITLAKSNLISWKERSQGYSRSKLFWDVAINFLIPTGILLVICLFLRANLGYRFNPITYLVMLPSVMPDVFVLVVLGTLPDYIQGIIKLIWIIRQKKMIIGNAALS